MRINKIAVSYRVAALCSFNFETMFLVEMDRAGIVDVHIQLQALQSKPIISEVNKGAE